MKLTWDKDDDARKRALAKRVTKDELRDDDFKVRLCLTSCQRPAPRKACILQPAVDAGCLTVSMRSLGVCTM